MTTILIIVLLIIIVFLVLALIRLGYAYNQYYLATYAMTEIFNNRKLKPGSEEINDALEKAADKCFGKERRKKK